MADELNKLRAVIRDNLERKRATRIAVVTSVPMDASGRRRPYVVATVGGQAGVRVYTESESHTFRTGDTIRIEEQGTPAAASYRAITYAAGARPISTMAEVSDETTINGVTFSPGDMIIGNPYGAHWWFDYSEGVWRIQDGATTVGLLGPVKNEYGIGQWSEAIGAIFGEYGPNKVTARITDLGGFQLYQGDTALGGWTPDGRIVTGRSDDMQIIVNPNLGLIHFKHAGETLAAFDATTLTMYGFQRWGAPLGPGIEAGVIYDIDENGDPIVDSNGEQQSRYVFRGIAESGVPFFAFMTGTVDDPNDVSFQLGKQGDDNRLYFADGTLTVDGTIDARSGTIHGFLTLGADGGIYQGTGTAASPDTGLKLWNDDGTGRIAGFNAGVEQAGFDTDGAFKWAAGRGTLDSTGQHLDVSGLGVARQVIDFYADEFGGEDIFSISATPDMLLGASIDIVADGSETLGSVADAAYMRLYSINSTDAALISLSANAGGGSSFQVSADNSFFASNVSLSGTLDLNGYRFILDLDGDTSITADTDDQIDIEIAGADDFQFTANTFTALAGSSISTDAITETTADAGVTISNKVIVGDGTNQTIIKSDGEIVLEGTARVLKTEWFSVGAFKAPGTKPASLIDYGIAGGWEFSDATDDTVVATKRLPHDMDRTTAPSLKIGWASATADPGDDSKQVVWQLEYLYLTANQDLTGAADDTVSATTSASTTTNGLTITTIAMDAPGASDQLVKVRIKRLGADGDDTLGDTAIMVGCGYNYTADKLGVAT